MIINPFIFGVPVATEFKITVDTTQAGSATDTFILPLQNGATSMTVFWGDGNSDLITSYNQAELRHTYASSGTYQISLDGSFYGINFAFAGDRLKLSSIDNWGTNQWGDCFKAFNGCQNMVGTYTDNPDLSLVVNLQYMFGTCTVFNSPLTLDTPNATNISYMFYQANTFSSLLDLTDTSSVSTMALMFFNTNFNEDISSWNISSLTTASNMFYFNTDFSTANYDLLLVGWQGQTHNNSVAFHAGTAQYSSGAPATARAGLITDLWTITDGGAV